MIWELGQGVVLGLGAAVPIGPVNVEIARRVLRGGFRAGVALGAGACTIDMTYALLVCAGIGRWLGENRVVATVIGIAGVLVLAWLAYGCFRAAAKGIAAGTETAHPPVSVGTGYVQGLVMTASNPVTLAFWFVALPAAVGITAGQVNGLGWVCAGVGTGALAWVVGFSGVLAFVGRWKRGGWMVLLDLVGGAILTGFAALAAWRVVRP